ncbi:YceD family protein [Reichenbachiella sp.]|uniref:YceD family protein n=1 Tax=Reichenbachiella sp. TaxID=2184521 RepID=UPI003BAFE1CD
MKADRQYKIDIFGLKIGLHEFDFEFDKKLFENIEDSVIESGHGKCTVILDKKERLISMDFKIEGVIELICDRSLESFDYPINIEENLIVKYGEEYDDSEDELLVIPDTQESLNVELNIYEYLTLAVPMKKIHPDFQDDEDDEEHELALVYTSEDEEADDKEDNEVIDPRWAALKNVKDLKK